MEKNHQSFNDGKLRQLTDISRSLVDESLPSVDKLKLLTTTLAELAANHPHLVSECEELTTQINMLKSEKRS
jgi:hypothetical protein